MNKKSLLINRFNSLQEKQKSIFFRMYGNLGTTIEEVSKNLKGKKLDWALTQINNTLEKNKLPKPEPITVQEKVVPIEERMLQDVLDVVRKIFFKEKMESSRSDCGGGGKIDFKFEDKDYVIEWDGFWDRSDWVEFRVSGNGVDFKHTEYYD